MMRLHRHSRVQDAQPPLPKAMGKRFVYVLFACWSLFAVFVYSHFSQLGDSESYLTGAYDDSGQARTVIITIISSKVIALVHNEVLVHLTFAMLAATGVAYMVRQAGLHGRYRWPFLAIALNPNFGVWASVVGRESLFVCLLGFFMGAVLGYFRQRGMRDVLIALLCLAGMTFIRSAYGAGLTIFYAMFLIYASRVRSRLGIGAQCLLFCLLAALALLVLWPQLDDYIRTEVLPKAKSYFTVASATTRTWIQMDSTGDLLSSLYWSLPLALIGPTLPEVVARPVMLPFLLSGLVIFGSTLYGIGVALRTPAGTVRKILVLGWLPAMLFIVVSFVPFGIYNPGSGIRYASCFLLFLCFPSMLRCAVAADAIRTESVAYAPAPGIRSTDGMKQ